MSRRFFVLFAAAAMAVAVLVPAGAIGVTPPEDLAASSDGVELLSSYTRQKVDITGGDLIPVVIVLEEDPVASYEGGIAGLPATSPKVTGKAINARSAKVKNYRAHLKKNHKAFADALTGAVSNADVNGDLDILIGGVTAVVPENSVATISRMAGVAAVYLDELEQPDTEVSPQFIGADDLWDELGGQEEAGEGVVVGVLDTGVWPEHPSYGDPDPAGNAYDPPAVAPGSNGFGPSGPRPTCDFGNVTFNPADAPFTCNNKLIGAYDFTDTYKLVIGLLPNEYFSARDADGHGTHTSSTAAGNGGVAASIFGVSKGTVSGVAPRAHVIMYKVCNNAGCFGSDSARAVEQAVLDEVDVLNFSISGGNDPYGDIVSLAFLNAYDNGVLVTPSAGNSGPGADTVAHREPWTLTVGASTTDRHFISTVDLVASNGDTLAIEGATVTGGIASPTSVVFPPAGSELCLSPFAAGTFSGEIVICQRGLIARVAKSFNVSAGGGGGMFLYNLVLQGLATDNHFIPSVHLENDAGAALLAFMGSHSGVTGTFTPGVATAVQGDKMAAFSSRGGPGQTLGISKPDVTAPGVQILAGHSPTPATITGGLPGQLFQSIQGTSMSAPHTAGAAALVKAAHPTWGPGQIKSALMTTALTDGVFKEDGATPADAFDYGSGRIQPASAAQATATISASGADFVALQAELWNANYPSLYVPNMPGIITVDRTFANELGKKDKVTISVDSPSDLDVEVGQIKPSGKFNPKSTFKLGTGDKTVSIRVDASDVPLGQTRMATIHFDPKKGPPLHFPVTIVRGQAPVAIDKECSPASVAEGETTTCTITLENTSFSDASVSVVDKVPVGLTPPTSVSGATARGRTVSFAGTLAGASPPIVNVAVDPTASAFGYFPLSIFGSTIDIGATDESIANFGIPAFEYAGETYNTIGIVSNGYIVVGGGTGADVDFINSDLPDAAIPNNVLAPFWTDLNPASGGRVLINVLGDGSNVWTVVEWESVRSFGDAETTTTQVWIGTNTDADPGEDISFVYGPDVSDGDGGFLTVGAENKFGNSGGTTFFDGVGVPPSPSLPTGYEVDVFSTPGAPGGSHVITFDTVGHSVRSWVNYALMDGDIWQGTAVARFAGETHD